ncbi:MAG: chromosome segregation protein SMC [Candidatus Diapherotrites archaeon]|nr:chromosome segregation protein SMC [Candidatus Diapherotrites archaeon]
MIELKKLVLKNFKSFKKAEVPFKRGFTAIIGPNGSGKSNLLDALLFVLGETSMKSLRVSKMVELINYNARENYAKVELKLKKDNETIVISRIIDKKGKSECRINGKKVALNEVVNLVEELGLRNRHNFVAQGDVTRIIEMSPEQRRAIIDELAGIREFELKKEEAQKNLEKVNQRIKDVKLVLQERLSRLEELQREREQAERYKKLVERKDQVRASILKTEIDSIQAELEKNRKKLKKCQENIEKKNGERERIRKRIEELEKRSEELSAKILEEQQKAFQEFGKEAEKLKADIRVLEEAIETKRATIAKLEKQESELADELRSMLKQREQEKKELEQREQELSELSEDIQALEDEIAGFAEEAQKAEQLREAVESEIEGIEAKISELQQAIVEKQKALGELTKENEMRLLRIKELSNKLEELKQARHKSLELREHIKILEKKSLKTMVLQLRNQEKKLMSRESELSAKLEQTREALTNLEKASAKCPVCESTLSEQKKRLLKEKKRNELKMLEARKNENAKAMKEIASKIAECESELAKLSELKHELQLYEAKLWELEKVEKHIQEEKGQIKSTDVLTREISRLESELRELQEQRAKQREQLEELSGATHDEKYAELTEMKHRHAMLESSIQIAKSNIANITKSCDKLRARMHEIAQEKKSLNEEIEVKEQNVERLKEKLAKLEEARIKRSEALSELLKDKENTITTLNALRNASSTAENEIRNLEREVNEIRLEMGKAEVRLADLEEELKEMPQVTFLSGMSLKELRKELSRVEKELEAIGPVNLRASESIKDEEAQLIEVKEKIAKLEEERDAVLEMIEKIEVRKREVFMNCFNVISKNFSEMFYKFFEGTGTLSLTDYENVTEAGLIIEAKHKEKFQSIDAMSGGEKSLTALAFIFAVLLYRPAPLYVLDEADAALDEINSMKVAKAIKELSKKAHIIAITHNNVVIKHAMQIIGVTLSKDKSSIIGLDLAKHNERLVVEASN